MDHQDGKDRVWPDEGADKGQSPGASEIQAMPFTCSYC